MAVVHCSAATLRVIGDDLLPDEITRLLGCEPTAEQTKGQVIRHRSGRERVARTGAWRLAVPDEEPADLNKQVAQLLGKLTDDLAVWKEIGSRFHVDLFCGLFMEEGVEGETLSAETLEALGSRGIELELDIYAPGDELNEEEPNQRVESNAGSAPRDQGGLLST